MLITFLVLFGLIDVIYKPMTHILGMSSDLIAQAQGIMEGLGVAFSHYSPQTSIITSVQANPEAYSALGQDFINAVQSFDLNFLGINLGETPSLALNIMVLIPILSGVTAFLSSWIAMKNSPTPMEGPGAGTMKTMMLISPLMSLYIAFQVPAGVGIYWIISNLLMLLQSVVLNKFYNPKEMAAKARQEAEERREKERQERSRRAICQAALEEFGVYGFDRSKEESARWRRRSKSKSKISERNQSSETGTGKKAGCRKIR